MRESADESATAGWIEAISIATVMAATVKTDLIRLIMVISFALANLSGSLLGRILPSRVTRRYRTNVLYLLGVCPGCLKSLPPRARVCSTRKECVCWTCHPTQTQNRSLPPG